VRSNLKFAELLREVDKIGRITSKDLAHSLGRSVKEISNDLGRLRQMGFVKGDYEKRICKLRGPWGDVCNRGYQYIYYVSEQELFELDGQYQTGRGF
jgi:predicted transcriptional regulator